MKTAGVLAGVALVACVWGCAVRPAPESVVDGAAPVDLVRAPDNAGRPSDWKQLQTWLALRGLAFTGDGVEIDPVAALEVDAEVGPEASRASVTASDGLLASNARVKAMGAARDAILADPANAEAYRALGRALISKRKDDLALDAFKTAAVLAPASGAIRAGLADAYNRVGLRDEARAAYREAVRLDPADARSFGRLAVLDYYAGDDLSAWRHAREAERRGGGVPPQFLVLLSERTPEP